MRNPISRDRSVCSIKQQYTKEASHEMHHEALRLNCPEALRTNAERERQSERASASESESEGEGEAESLQPILPILDSCCIFCILVQRDLTHLFSFFASDSSTMKLQALFWCSLSGARNLTRLDGPGSPHSTKCSCISWCSHFVRARASTSRWSLGI